MKNKFLLMAVMVLFLTGAYAQDSAPVKPDYNRWTIEGGIGFIRPYHNFNPGYSPATIGLFGAELSARYMINEYFGFKFGFDYGYYDEGDDSYYDFETKQYGFNVQGVANLGRMMKFETWTRTFNLLAHAGVGVSMMDYDVHSDDDYMGNVLGGFTGQVKVSPRVSLYGDISGKCNIRQNLSFNGGAKVDQTPLVFTGTVGISVALGKKAQHADWFLNDESIYDAFDSRVTAVENGLAENLNGDRQLGTRVDELGRKVDDLDRKVSVIPVASAEADPNELIAKLINDGYVNIYFDFNSTKVKSAAYTINILRTYMIDNPGVNVDLLGYADERGTEEYNQKLSQKRADAVADMLVKAGVDSSRLNAQGKGEDISIDKNTPEAYQLARRVTFAIK